MNGRMQEKNQPQTELISLTLSYRTKDSFQLFSYSNMLKQSDYPHYFCQLQIRGSE